MLQRAMIGLLWLVCFVILCAAPPLGLALAVLHHLALAAVRGILELGAEAGLALGGLLLCWGALPGTRTAADTQPFDGFQGVWGMAGFGLSMLLGTLLMSGIGNYEMIVLLLRHSRRVLETGSPAYLLCIVFTGELSAALFLARYASRLGPAGIASPAGLAFAPAARRAYGEAMLGALGIILLAFALLHLFPPDLPKLENQPFARLFEGGGLSLLPALALATLLAPVLEEVSFRGFGFGGLAVKLGPLWAGVITTVVFTAVHAPEKMLYPPGFLGVALVAAINCWLRVRWGSIRPGILLHILCNTGLLAAGLA